MLTRRSLVAALAGLATASARAQDLTKRDLTKRDLTKRDLTNPTFPSRPVTVVVPYPAGGPVDVTGRLIAHSVGNTLGQPMLVDNRGGGAGVIGSLAVARAEPDGHTLILGTNQTHATNQSLLKNCPYDAVTDFLPVVGIADVQHVLVVRRGLEVADVAALVALAKNSPGQLNYASTGVGSAAHLAGELFKTRAGIDLQHIPFRGSAPLLTELLAGRVDLSFATLPSVVSSIEAGAVRALAVASATRAARLPGLPTLAETGVPGVEADAWFALFAPAKTAAPIIDAIYGAVSAGLSTEAAKDAVAKQGMTLRLRPPAEIAAWLPDEVAKWAAVIKSAHVSVD